jgi:DNA-binding response OmpR family regulator
LSARTSGHVTSDVVGQPNLSDFPVLVVDPDPADRLFVTTALSAAGFGVRTADNYHDARSLLVVGRPLILMTEVRLGAYNGLQLALRARAATPKIPVLVMSGWPDPVLQRDAESIGATFAVKPLTPSELLAAVVRTMVRPPMVATDAEEPIRAPFERRQGQRRAAATREVQVERRVVERRRNIVGQLLSGAMLPPGV